MSRTLEEAALEASTCTRCRLAQGRTQVVYGVGDPNADLMFIGEAPGFHEDKQGEPFVGAAGQLLTRMLGEIGMTREEVYIANILKCRPPGNRDPLPDDCPLPPPLRFTFARGGGYWMCDDCAKEGARWFEEAR